MKSIDYTTYWLEPDAPAPAPTHQPSPPPRQQQGTLYLRNCGPHVALYALAGACIGFFAPILFGLLVMLLQAIF